MTADQSPPPAKPYSTSRLTQQQATCPPIVSLGDLVADLIVVIPDLPVAAGQHQLAREIRLEPGGGANFLIAGARLGYPMAAIGALGNDIWGQQVAELIRAEGVDLSRVRQSGSTTCVVVLVSQSGDHVFLGRYGYGPTIELEPSDVALLTNCGALYCAGYTLAETRLANLTIAALELARGHHRPVYFDPGPQIVDVPPALRRQALSLTDTLLLAEVELPLLTSGPISGLRQLGPTTVVLKRGADGCAIYQNQLQKPVVDLPGYPVNVVDTAAAGDSFNAAFMVAKGWGWSLADCARLANAVGAAKVKKLGGGRNVPTLAEVRAIIKEFKVGLEV